MEYKFDEQSVKELMEWAQTAQLPQELELSKAERIFDVKLCIESDLSCIRPLSRCFLQSGYNSSLSYQGRAWRRNEVRGCLSSFAKVRNPLDFCGKILQKMWNISSYSTISIKAVII